MKITADQLNAIPVFGASTRPVQRVAKAELKDAGVAFATYGIGEGEIIQFPENIHENLFAQPTVVGGKNMQYLVGCMRGRDAKSMKPSYFTLGSLIRQDAHREYTCDFTREMAEKFANHEQRLDHLAGKTIKGTKVLEIDVVKFDRAINRPVRDENNNIVTEKGRATQIDYVA